MSAINNTRPAHFITADGAYLFTADHNITRRNIRSHYQRLIRSVRAKHKVNEAGAIHIIFDTVVQNFESGQYNAEAFINFLLVTFASSSELLDANAILVSVNMSDSDNVQMRICEYDENAQQAA